MDQPQEEAIKEAVPSPERLKLERERDREILRLRCLKRKREEIELLIQSDEKQLHSIDDQIVTMGGASLAKVEGYGDRKHSNGAADETDTVVVDDDDEFQAAMSPSVPTQPKRKRGRPPKYPAADVLSSSPRKGGRSKKEPQLDENGNPLPPRKRGRPPKIKPTAAPLPVIPIIQANVVEGTEEQHGVSGDGSSSHPSLEQDGAVAAVSVHPIPVIPMPKKRGRGRPRKNPPKPPPLPHQIDPTTGKRKRGRPRKNPVYLPKSVPVGEEDSVDESTVDVSRHNHSQSQIVQETYLSASNDASFSEQAQSEIIQDGTQSTDQNDKSFTDQGQSEIVQKTHLSAQNNVPVSLSEFADPEEQG